MKKYLVIDHRIYKYLGYATKGNTRQVNKNVIRLKCIYSKYGIWNGPYEITMPYPISVFVKHNWYADKQAAETHLGN